MIASISCGMSNNLTPLAVCERLIGPYPVIAAICGYKAKSPYVWLRPSKGRAAGDFPSSRIIRQILAYAAARSIPLTAEDLIWGADADELAARLATPPARFAAHPRMEAAE